MDEPQPLEADELVEAVDDSAHPFRTADVVARTPQVRGVEAEGEPRSVAFHAIEDRRQLLDARTERAAAAGRVLEHQDRAGRGLGEHRRHVAPHPPQRVGPRVAEVRPDVGVHERRPVLPRPAQLGDQPGA